ncbi:MAG: VanZ family protein [Gemmatimonadales bacterium]
MSDPGREPGDHRFVRVAFLALSTLAILVATLRPGGSTLPRGWSLSLASGEAAFAEVIQNLLLFIPLGMALVWNGVPPRPLRAIAIGAGLSCTVEFIQQWLPGRDPSVGDILCNTISTAIGVALVRTAPRWLTVTPRRAARQSVATALAAATVWLGTGALLRPVLPPPPYRDIWNPSFNYWGKYQGNVLSASLGPLPLSQGWIDDTSLTDPGRKPGEIEITPGTLSDPGRQPGEHPLSARLLLLSGQPLRITAIAARRPPGRPSPLVAILDARDTRVLVVAVDRTDLALHYHIRAVALTLGQPDLRWRNALDRIAPGDTFTVQTWRGERGERGSCLGVNSERRCGLGYTIGDGWKLIFYPEHFPGWALTLLNALWVGGWLLGVGYWGGRAAMGGVAIGLAIVGLALVPALTGLNATPVVEWIGGVAGIVGGYLASGRDRVLKDRLGYYTRP